MAEDIAIKFDKNTLEGDLILEEGDLERDKGLESSVLISLFTDRRANDTDNYDNNDKKGWWGDLLPEVEGDQIGSRLWLLDRSKSTEENQLKAKEYIYEALEWMIEDGVCIKIDIDTWTFGLASNMRLGVNIKIYKSDEDFIAMKFDDLWNPEYTSVIGG